MPVRDEHALEAPFAAQHVAQQPLVGVNRYAVDLVVGGHDRADARLDDGGAEGCQEVFADFAFGVVRRAAVGAGFGLPVDGKVFGGGEDMFAVNHLAPGDALQSADGCYAYARAQVGVFAIGFFGAAPTRFTRQVEDGGEHVVFAARAGLPSGYREDTLDQFGVPGAGQADGLGEHGAAKGHQAVQGLVHKEDRDAQAGLFAQEFLEGVGPFGGGASW